MNALIGRGLCQSMLSRIRTKPLPMVTSYPAPAVAAERTTLTGFPFPLEVLGDRSLDILRHDLARQIMVSLRDNLQQGTVRLPEHPGHLRPHQARILPAVFPGHPEHGRALDIQAEIPQEDPRDAGELLFDLRNEGRLAEAAWNGFLKVRKHGTYAIRDLLARATSSQESVPESLAIA